ncbi:MAG: hypothetical protein GX542_13585 [Rhodococcus sp.]|nr:hypothetical protein [Rhodococcus sp. (in: high G+C Gram-positive bacteria)]
MKNRKVARGVAAIAASAGLAAAGIMAAAPANAQAIPFNLYVNGGVECKFAQPGQPWGDIWTMTRWMTVTNSGPQAAPDVVLQEFAGQTRYAKSLGPGEQLRIETTWAGCWPASISGYTHSSLIDPLHDNVGYWANVEIRDVVP